MAKERKAAVQEELVSFCFICPDGSTVSLQAKDINEATENFHKLHPPLSNGK